MSKTYFEVGVCCPLMRVLARRGFRVHLLSRVLLRVDLTDFRPRSFRLGCLHALCIISFAAVYCTVFVCSPTLKPRHPCGTLSVFAVAIVICICIRLSVANSRHNIDI